MIEATDYQEILFEVKDDVARITINRPEVMNAFREQTLDELIHAVRSTREDSPWLPLSSPAPAIALSLLAAISMP